MSVFSEKLKKERNAKKREDPKWTQEYTAKLLGVARSTYTAYENGTKEPPRETINKIADTFEVSIDYLEGRTNERRPITELLKYVNQTNSSSETIRLLEKKAKEMGLSFSDPKFQQMIFEALELLRLARGQN